MNKIIIVPVVAMAATALVFTGVYFGGVNLKKYLQEKELKNQTKKLIKATQKLKEETVNAMGEQNEAK